MNITFYRNSTNNTYNKWDGKLIRYGNIGASGTETAFLLNAEYFGSLGHNVKFMCPTCTENEYNNVKYTSLIDFADTEILFICPWDSSFINFNMPNIKSIIVHFHCQWFTNFNTIRHLKNKMPHINIQAVYPSEWAKNAVSINSPNTLSIINKEHVIYNPLMSELLIPINDIFSIKKQHSFVWGASWERGGHVAMKVFEKLEFPNKSFIIMDYVINSDINKYSKNNITSILSSDKNNVYHNLRLSEYFVYPLVLPDSRVHKDTFGCVVSEALANGVIVLSWDIPVLRELFNEVIQFIPFPNNANIQNLKSYENASDSSLYSDEAIDSIIQLIKKIEENKEYKRELQEKSIYFARNKFNRDKINSQLNEILDII